MNFVDPNGNFGFWIVALIGAGILGLVGLGATAYADYTDDGEIFNGSIGADAYIGNTLVAASIGALVSGLIFTFGPSIASFLGSSLSSAIPALGTLSTCGALALGGITITVSGAQILQGAGISSGITIMAYIIGKSGGYTVKKFPNDHDPTHVHIFGDDIADKAHGIRIGLDGNPLPGQGKLPPGARKALKKLWELILKALSK